MKDVTALTLRKGEMTTGRRSSPVPQVRQRPSSSPPCRVCRVVSCRVACVVSCVVCRDH